jgi:hypothetical protein
MEITGKRKTAVRRRLAPALLAAGAVLLAGCAQTKSAALAGVLPGADIIPGWKPAGEILTFTRETLFDYINGASEYYFTYTFEKVAANRYADEAGAELNVEIWQMTEPEDAYGLFSGRAGGETARVGSAVDAVLESGIRLVFWQNRYYVNLTAVDTIADEDLRRFAEHISQALPAGGEKPAILGHLPADGLVPESVKFFHQELAVQDRIWLGGENLLGLGLRTDAVLARYRAGGAELQLLLVEYPDAAGAAAGLKALAGGAAEIPLAADANGGLLGAVFGQGEEAVARNLLAKSLGK